MVKQDKNQCKAYKLAGENYIMKIGILGSGDVGRKLADGFIFAWLLLVFPDCFISKKCQSPQIPGTETFLNKCGETTKLLGYMFSRDCGSGPMTLSIAFLKCFKDSQTA